MSRAVATGTGISDDATPAGRYLVGGSLYGAGGHVRALTDEEDLRESAYGSRLQGAEYREAYPPLDALDARTAWNVVADLLARGNDASALLARVLREPGVAAALRAIAEAGGYAGGLRAAEEEADKALLRGSETPADVLRERAAWIDDLPGGAA